MPHSIILMRQKLDCVAANYSEAASSANDLKRACNDADSYYQASLLDANLVNGNEVHELLEEVQDLATNWCDNGAGSLGASEMCETLDGFTSALNDLI